MATDSAVMRTSAVDPEVTAAMAIHDRLVPLKQALGIENLSDQEVQLFAMVAQRSRLDPFAKQIYAIKRGGKVSYQTGIDGYRSIAARTGEYSGSDEATYEECDCEQKPTPHPSVARVTVKRIHSSGRELKQVGVARWHELRPSDSAQWTQMPWNQLAKCAEANGLRKLFPSVLGDIYIEDEMAQAGPPENGALVAAASKPKPAERLAARRQALEGDVVVIGADPVVEEPTAALVMPIQEAASGLADETGPVGLDLFRARFALADPKPDRQAVVAAGERLFGKEIPDLAMKETKDWPLVDRGWVRLADELGLPPLEQ